MDRLNTVLDGIIGNISTISSEEWERRQKELEEWERRQKEEKLQAFKAGSGMDSQYFDASLDSNVYDTDYEKTCIEGLKNFCSSVKEGQGLFLIILGTVGTGKTYSACAVMNELKYGTYLDMPELNLKLHTADRFGAKESREQLLHRLASCKLLVLDEVGRFAGNQGQEQEILFYLLNKRYANNRPTVICSNLNVKEFSSYIGQALTDRLKGRNIKIILDGKSLRG